MLKKIISLVLSEIADSIEGAQIVEQVVVSCGLCLNLFCINPSVGGITDWSSSVGWQHFELLWSKYSCQPGICCDFGSCSCWRSRVLQINQQVSPGIGKCLFIKNACQNAACRILLSALILCSEFNFSVLIRAPKRASS